MSQKIKVGIVGLGLVSTSHYKGYASYPDAEVIAVCDTDLSRAREFANLYHIPLVYQNYEEMLQHADIDVVDIATPTFLHAPMAFAAAKAKKHIHCEKPFCRFVREGMAVVEEARRQKVKLVVGETYVFISSHIKARELIDNGEIGRPLQIRQRHGAWLERPQAKVYTGPADRNWRIDPEKSGGGKFPWIFDHAVHFFATAEYFIPHSKIDQVYAVTSTCSGLKKSGAAHDPYMTASLDIPIISWKYEDQDCTGVWMRAERLNGKYDYMQGFHTTIIGEKGMIEVLGEGGSNLLWEGQQQHLLLHRENKEPVCFRFDEGGDDVWESDISYYSQGHIHHVHHLLDCIKHDRQPRYGGEDGVHAVQCTLSVIQSAQHNCPIKVSEVDPDYKAYE